MTENFQKNIIVLIIIIIIIIITRYQLFKYVSNLLCADIAQ